MSTKEEVVASLIDQMVEGGLDPESAVSTLLDDAPVMESVEIDIEENCEDLACVECGADGLTPAVVETEDGGEIPVLHCESCDTGYIPEAAMEGDEDDEEFDEVEIDPDDPLCPECGEDALDIHKDETEDGEEVEVLACEACGTGFVPADQE
jgi:hypothetical protein